MKKFIAMLSALCLLTMCGCSSSEESSESKESSSKVVTTTVETTTEIVTETTTKKQREKPSFQDHYTTEKFNGTYNGEYFSIDIPTGSNLITNNFYGADYIEFEIPSANDVTPDSAKFKLYTLDMSFMNYADNSDYITQNFKISEDEIYTNPYGIEMIRKYGSSKETFLFYNNGNAIKLEFDNTFSISKIQSLLETIQFTDKSSEN